MSDISESTVRIVLKTTKDNEPWVKIDGYTDGIELVFTRGTFFKKGRKRALGLSFKEARLFADALLSASTAARRYPAVGKGMAQ